MFPDFALVDRRDGERKWLAEIVGFWTREYFAAKIERLRRSGRRDLIVCVEEKLGCRDEDLPANLPIVRFSGKVDAAAVLAIAQGPPPCPTDPSSTPGHS